MNGFSVLMFIFGFLILLVGLYIYTGHNSELLLCRTYSKKTTKAELKIIGKWTMIISLISFVLSLLGLFFEI